MADNIFNTIKARAITVLNGLSGLNTVENFDDFVQGDFTGGYPASHLTTEIEEVEPAYYRHPTANDMEVIGSFNIMTIVNPRYREDVSDRINDWRIAIENAITNDATLEGLTIDIYKQSEKETLFNDNKFGLLEQNYYVQYQYNHNGGA